MSTVEDRQQEWRMRQARDLVRRLKGEKVTTQTMMRFEAILLKVQQAKDTMRLYEADSDVTPVLRLMVKAIEHTVVTESCSALLRTFLFHMPTKQERAYEEIEARLNVLIWIINQLKSF